MFKAYGNVKYNNYAGKVRQAVCSVKKRWPACIPHAKPAAGKLKTSSNYIRLCHNALKRQPLRVNNRLIRNRLADTAVILKRDNLF